MLFLPIRISISLFRTYRTAAMHCRLLPTCTDLDLWRGIMLQLFSDNSYSLLTTRGWKMIKFWRPCSEDVISTKSKVKIKQWNYQDCKVVIKMTLFRLRSFSFRDHGSSYGALGFHECNSCPVALFFHNMAPAPVGIINTLIFSVVMVCLKMTGKWKISSTQN